MTGRLATIAVALTLSASLAYAGQARQRWPGGSSQGAAAAADKARAVDKGGGRLVDRAPVDRARADSARAARRRPHRACAPPAIAPLSGRKPRRLRDRKPHRPVSNPAAARHRVGDHLERNSRERNRLLHRNPAVARYSDGPRVAKRVKVRARTRPRHPRYRDSAGQAPE